MPRFEQSNIPKLNHDMNRAQVKGAMTNKEYIETLIKLSGVKYYDTSVFDRKLNITVALDDYDHPSTAIMAFEGSPPRLEVIFSIKPWWNDVLIVQGEAVRRSQRREKLIVFLRQFVVSRQAEWNVNCAK